MKMLNIKTVENKYNITLGSDPEVFIERDGKIVSGIGMIPGTKHEPYPITDLGHMIQTDNIAFEFNIPPSTNPESFVSDIQYIMEYLEGVANSNGCTLSKKSSESVDPSELTHRQAKTFGCDPDFDVYVKDINPSPKSKDKNLRCVGGHVAIGYPNPTVETTEKIVKAFDMFVVLPALLIDKDERRRELYGKAGAFRFKDPWGVECRALSNFWIQSTESIQWVFNQTIFAVNKVLDNEIDSLLEMYSDKVREAINNNDKALAESLLTLLEVEVASEIV